MIFAHFRPRQIYTDDNILLSDKSGTKQDVDFLLLPGNYDSAVSEVPGLPWVCPIRSCRLAFLKSSTLDFHWTV